MERWQFRMKKFTSKTAIFISVLVFVKIFENIFGIRNSQVGITVMIAALVFIQEDLTDKPIKNLMRLILANLVLGIFAHIASYDLWLGLILNFVTLSSIGYLLSYNLNKVMIIPFALQYLFMLYNPVSGLDFSKRLLGLGIGAILIMALQFIIYRKNSTAKVEESKILEVDDNEKAYRHIRVFGRTYKIHTVRAAYAIRVGLTTAITAFVVALLNIHQGRWIVYTIFSLTELYSENCIMRSKQRLQGTLAGVLIILALFMFIRNNTVRGLMVLVGGYLDGYTTNYRDKVLCITMSVVASTSLINGTITTAIERILYVFIGIILALIVDKLVLTKKLEDFKQGDVILPSP